MCGLGMQTLIEVFKKGLSDSPDETAKNYKGEHKEG